MMMCWPRLCMLQHRREGLRPAPTSGPCADIAQGIVALCGEASSVSGRMLRRVGTSLVRPMLWKVDQLGVLCQLRGVKADTGIVGLKALPNAREVLREKLTDVLQAVSEQVPAQAEYRKAVEATMNYRRAPQTLPSDPLPRQITCTLCFQALQY